LKGVVLLLKADNRTNAYWGGNFVWFRHTCRTLRLETSKEDEKAVEDSRIFVEKSK